MALQHNNPEPVVALVVAAGSGVRLGGDIPKALRRVGGQSLLARSVARLAEGGCTAAVVVIPADAGPEFADALASAPIPVTIAAGGPERQDSVGNGLAVIEGDASLAGTEIVLVHDAARAFVPAAVVRRVIDAVRGGAVAVTPVIEVTDTIRELTAVGSTVVDRASLRAVQTPQGFDLHTLVEAHRLVREHTVPVTDDASACEFAGHDVALVEGDREAFKVTTPFDLLLAEALVAGEEH